MQQAAMFALVWPAVHSAHDQGGAKESKEKLLLE
jgi:hypothetical protein